MLGQIRVIQIRSTRSALRNRRRGGARLKAMLSWWRRNRFSASSRHGGLNKSTMNIPSECRIASIGRDHAMILPHDANPKPDGIFGKDKRKNLQSRKVKNTRHVRYLLRGGEGVRPTPLISLYDSRSDAPNQRSSQRLGRAR